MAENQILYYISESKIFLSLSFYYRTHDNRPIDDLKSPAGKTDYHTIGACFEVLRSNNRLDH